MSAPCLVCGDLHDPPMCAAPEAAGPKVWTDQMVALETTAALYRRLLVDLLMAIETGEGFPAALMRARRGLGMSE